MHMTKNIIPTATYIFLGALCACGTDPGQRALSGAGIGAGAGAVGGVLLGDPLAGAVIGGAAGAATGAFTSPNQIDLNR